MCATAGACINETWLFSSAAVMPQSKSIEVCSSAAVVPHKVNLQSCVVGRRPLCHKVNLPRCETRRRLCQSKSTAMWSSAAPSGIMTCDIFGTGQTNILALCYLIGKTCKPAYSSATLKSLKSTLSWTLHSTKLLKKLLTWPHTFHWRISVMIPLKRVKVVV